MSAPLSRTQKAYLAQLANEARRKVAPGEKAEGWRHEQVVKACGKAGLRCCSQDDYGLIKGHLLELMGKHGAAFKAQFNQATNDRRVAEAVLVRECQVAGLSLKYAESICQRKNKCGLFDASEKQIWHLVYTVRSRAQAKRQRSEAVDAMAGNEEVAA